MHEFGTTPANSAFNLHVWQDDEDAAVEQVKQVISQERQEAAFPACPGLQTHVEGAALCNEALDLQLKHWLLPAAVQPRQVESQS